MDKRHFLIVATNHTPPSLDSEIRQRRHQRVDYISLAEQLCADYVDYRLVSDNPRLRRLEERCRIDFRLAIKVARLVRDRGYDTVLSMSERVGIPLGWLLGRCIKHVVILHHPMSPSKISLLRRLKPHRNWSRLVFISQVEAEHFRQALNILPERVMVLHTPVDTAFFSSDAVSAHPQNYVHSVGSSHRDYATLIRAIRELPDIPCDFRVGSAWVNNPMDYENEPIPSNVQIRPYVHPSDLRRYFVESRFTIVSVRATTQWSAGCTSVQIAQSMGQAVIATRLPGLAEYVLDGETGVLVQPRDPQGMKEAIEMLWRDPSRAKAMGRRAREWIRSQFSFERWLERIGSVLVSACTF
ncbi:MAG: glycosyltransferase family 4 protein [Anaerolineae bacterium]|nr:glycosyltransferase family 4 protein [Anaerolineae bacterium]